MTEHHYVNPKRLLAPLATTTGKVQWLGIAVLATIMGAAVLAPVLSAYGPTEVVCAPFEHPRPGHIFGCDDAGRDLFAQLIYGARVSLFVGLSVAIIATTAAVILAILAGLNGGWVDRLIMRFVDVALSLPFLPLVIVLGVYLGASLTTQILVIALVMWAQPVRELRSQILSVRAEEFVEASKAMGASRFHIGFRHILPEVAPLVVPQFVRIAHSAILVETSLSFLGLGDPLQSSWGAILYHANARTAFLTGSWLWWIVPAGVAVSITVTALAFIGFGYDASLSPRMRHRRGPIKAPTEPPDSDAAFSVRNLSVTFHSDGGTTDAVCDVSLDLRRGELVGLVGESGSGKSTLALAALGLLRISAEVRQGSVLLAGQDLLRLDRDDLRRLRGHQIALIPQSAMNSLNPVVTIGRQLKEALSHGGHTIDETTLSTWLERVGLEARHARCFPHELSGGMRQRAVIAIAICNAPDVVIADEPTTGLDVLVQEEIMALLLKLRQKLNLSILFVTHNLPLIARHADRLEVMYRGAIVDRGTASHLRAAASHAHTRDLFESLPEIDGAKRWQASLALGAPLLSLQTVSKGFRPRNSLGFTSGSIKLVLKDVSLDLHRREKLGLVGGSGSGKSTIARLMMGLLHADTGEVLFKGNPLRHQAILKRHATSVHMVFQDPYGSMRNAMSIFDIVSEPLRIQGFLHRDDTVKRVQAALDAVYLPSDGAFLSRLPIQLSGGQRQRVAFARAIVSEPKVIIADEPTSMLDQSVRMEIMTLMEDLRQQFGTAFLFITHDIVLARHFCDRIIVLRDGCVVEEGPADTVIHTPTHDYTKRLIAAA
ncbi:MAG: ATP-binding cassette domain-containing protein [Pseudomonadota bacterium]